MASRNIWQFLLGFLDRQSSLSRFSILVFRILKICLAVPSGSRYHFMIDQYCAYRFRPSPEREEVGVNLKSKKKFEKIYELKNFTCKRYWLIKSSWFWNRFRNQSFWHFSAFSSIQLSFNGLVLFFPHQIEPSAKFGPVVKNFRWKNFLLKTILSPLVIPYELKFNSLIISMKINPYVPI